MTIHPGASHSPPHLTTLSRLEKRQRGFAHSSWMGTLYDNHHHFPLEDNTQGSLPEWIAQPLEHMVHILCGECGESGRMPFWNCSTDGQRLPVLSASFPLSISLSLCRKLLCSFFSLYFLLEPLITCMVSLSTCCFSVLGIESVKFTNGVCYVSIHTRKPLCFCQ